MLSSFHDACDELERALTGDFRSGVITQAAGARSSLDALARLRDGMRAHEWRAGAERLSLSALVRDLEAATSRDEFNVLREWDGKKTRLNDDTIAVEMVNFVARERGSEPLGPATLAVLLDYYFTYILALLAVRAWDVGSPEHNLDRVTRLMEAVHGPHGSGHRFVDDAEMLLILATSHYEPLEHGYDLMLDRCRNLDAPHRARVAIGHAQTMGCHLRYGYEATYNRDIAAMRTDNVADYPWLGFAAATMMAEYGRLVEAGVSGLERERAAEAVMAALSPDAAALVTDAGGATAVHEADRQAFLERFTAHRDAFLQDVEPMRPTAGAYSPVSLFYNFAHNVVKGSAADAALWGDAWTVSLGDLFTALPPDEARSQAKTTLANTLTGYARAAPDTVRGRPMPAIVYDPRLGRQMFSAAMREVRGAAGLS